MRTIAVLSILVCLTGRATWAASDDRGRCTDGVGMAGAKLASASLKLLAHCRKGGDGDCSLAGVTLRTAWGRAVLKARQYSASTVGRACRSVPAAQFPIATCPTHHTVAIPDVDALARCVEALVDERTQAMLGDLLGVPPTCGDGLRAGAEECDGSDDAACPGHCGAGCACGGSLGTCVGGAGYGSCRTDAECSGRCNLNFEECFGDGDCHADTCGRCSQTNETCETEADCVQANVCATNFCVQNSCNEPCDAGRCTSGKACTTDADCPVRGYCPLTIDSCTADQPCPAAAGYCNLSGATCTTTADCQPLPGYCTTTGDPCSTSTDCAPNTCQTDKCRLSGNTCASDSDCTVHCAGSCVLGSIFGTPVTCQTAADCPNPNTCLTHTGFCFDSTCQTTGTACTADADCALEGTCFLTGETCQTAADCPVLFDDYCEFGCAGSESTCFSDADCTPHCSYPAPGFCLN